MTGYQPFVCGNLIKGHRTAGTELLCADTDFGTQTELTAVCETGRGIDINTCRIDEGLEYLCIVLVLGNDAFTVA